MSNLNRMQRGQDKPFFPYRRLRGQSQKERRGSSGMLERCSVVLVKSKLRNIFEPTSATTRTAMNSHGCSHESSHEQPFQNSVRKVGLEAFGLLAVLGCRSLGSLRCPGNEVAISLSPFVLVRNCKFQNGCVPCICAMPTPAGPRKTDP